MNGDIPSVPIITLAGVSSLTNGIFLHFLPLLCRIVWYTSVVIVYTFVLV